MTGVNRLRRTVVVLTHTHQETDRVEKSALIKGTVYLETELEIDADARQYMDICMYSVLDI